MSYKVSPLNTTSPENLAGSGRGSLLAQVTEQSPKIPAGAIPQLRDMRPREQIREPVRPYDPETDGLLKIPRYRGPTVLVNDDKGNVDGATARQNTPQTGNAGQYRYDPSNAINPTLPQRVGRGTNARALQLNVPDDGGVRFNPALLAKSVTLKQLEAMNPAMAKGGSPALFGDKSFRMFTGNSGFLKRIPGMTGMVVTKPIDLGGGLKLPVGTVVSGSEGNTEDSGTINQPSYSSKVDFKLPDGKEVTMRESRRFGSIATDITLPDGKKATLSGAPFFNPKSGTLGWVQERRSDGPTGNSKFSLTDPIAEKLSPEFRSSLGNVLK